MNTPKYENFPEELKAKPNWVVWEKGTKLPINPKTLGNAKANLPSTWTSLDVAKQALVKSPEKLGGVGFNPARNVLVLDFDDAGPGGKLPEETLKALKDAGTYTEFSPSGNGLRVLFRPTEGMEYLNIGKTKISFMGLPWAEVWNAGKYFTLTGNLVAPELNEIQPSNGFVSELLAHINGGLTAFTANGDPDGPRATTAPVATPSIPKKSSGLLVAKRNGPSEDEVWSILQRITADCPHDEWVRVGMGIHSWDSGTAGETHWHKWSLTAPNRYERKVANSTWASFKPNGNGAGKVTLGTLRHLADRYPLEVFPDAVRLMVEDVARVTRTPVELGGPIALGILSGCIGKGLVVRGAFGGNDGLPTIQVCLFMQSGGGKSTTIKPFTKKLNEWIFAQKEDVRIQSSKLKARAEFIQATMKKNVNAFSKQESNSLILENEKLGSELAEIETKLKGTEFMVEDVTPERLAVILGNNGANGQESVFSHSTDARKAVAVVLGCYKKEANTPDDTLYVKTFSWDPHNQQRQGNERSVDLKAPALPLLWLMQPDLADKLLGHPELMASGFIQRLTMDRIHHEPTEIAEPAQESPEARKGWDRLVFQILEKFRMRKQPLEIEAGEGVSEFILAYYNENIRRIRSGELADVESLAIRFAEMAWRFALLLHVARYGDEADKPLEMLSAQGGVRLARYYATRKLGLMMASRDKRDQDKVERVDELIKRKGHVTARTLAQYLHELSVERWRDWLEKKTAKGLYQRKEVKPEGGGPVSVQYHKPATTNATNATNDKIELVRS
jgi:hypothetical protein